MDADPMKLMEHRRPPVSGPGSGREAWIAHADAVEGANYGLQSLIESYRQSIESLDRRALKMEQELRHLREEADARKPKGGRERLPKGTADRILDAVRAGGSTRHVASTFHVSPMTVSRIARKAKAAAR